MMMIDDRSIQTALAAKGFYTGTIDGDYGSNSRKAARAALRAAGIADAAVWLDPRCKIAFQQLMLRDVGFEVGEIDGRIGPQTLAAMELWQNGLRDTTPPPAQISHLPTTWPRQADVPSFFGATSQNQVKLDLPYPMVLDWDPAKTVNRFSIHKKVHDSAKRVFTRIFDHYGQAQIEALNLHRFGGCLNDRAVRGGTRKSMHAWGIAIDFDPSHNQLRWGRDKAWLARRAYDPFWGFWEAEGWVSLGRLNNFDWMHVQAARL
jgi:hypothetical protein